MDHEIIVCEGSGAVRAVAREAGVWSWRPPLAPMGRWPVLNSAEDLIAISVAEPGPAASKSIIRMLHLDGRDAGLAYISPGGVAPVIAPRVPHYANWSPRGDILSFVAPGRESLGLFLSDAAGTYSADAIASGAPLFSSWRADGEALAIHSGADLELYFPANRGRIAISSLAVGFRTPVCIGDAVMYTTAEDGQAALMRWDIASGDASELARFGGGVALQHRPGTSQLSVAVAEADESGAFTGLYLIDAINPATHPVRVARGPFVAAFWSPVGDRVALVVPSQIGDGRYALRVVDATGATVASTEAFVPSQDFRLMIGFFDQYSVSHHLWAPDGSAFLASGRLGGDAVAWSFSDPGNDYIFYWEPRRGSPLEFVGPGDSAFFAPARRTPQ